MDSYLFYLISRLALGTFRLIPRPIAYRLLDALATLTFLADARHRKIARVNLTIAFPGLSDGERDAIAVRSFRNTARNLLEVSRMPLLNSGTVGSIVRYDPEQGLNNFELATSRGRPILYLTGHFSAWELLPTAHALLGHPLAFVTRPLDNPHLERYLQGVREAAGNTVIPKKSAAREILERLKAGGSVGILMDQNTTLQEGMFADLFGVPAATSTGLALFALRTGATVLPGYLKPMRQGKYTIKFLPPVELQRTGEMASDIAENTRIFNRILEGIIREQPEAWLWGHKRWKNQPPGNPADLYSLPQEELRAFVRAAHGGAQPPA